MNYYQLNTQQDYDEWDTFLQKCIKGHYAQLSTYLKSFTVYGADYKIIVAKDENNNIIAGIGLVIFGKGPFKLVSLPMGPIVDEKFQHVFQEILTEGLNYAKSIKAFLYQVQIPYSLEYTHPYAYTNISLPNDSFQEGFPFKVGSIVNQFFMLNLEIEIKKDNWEESMLLSFNANTRRDIRKSERNELEVREARNEKDVQQAYALMEENGHTQGYSTRTWKEFSPTILEQIKKGQAVILTVFKNDILLGVHYGVIAGHSYNYIMGGTRRVEKDYLVGHFLHWNVIKKARLLNLKSYDFTSTGSPGVLKFKTGFRPEKFVFDTPYFYILNPIQYNVFYKLFPILKNNKKRISNIIRFFSKKT